MLNKEQLLSYGDIEVKELLLDLLLKGLEAVDPYKAVKRVISRDNKSIKFVDKTLHVHGKIYVLGLGKASCSMAKAIEEILGDLIEDGLVVTKYGYSIPLENIRIIEAGHPIPDNNSLKAGVEAFELLKKVYENDLLIVLISGGGSALLEYPADNISLDDLIKTNDLLIKSGASIHEINIVRKHISRIKGGGIVKHCKGIILSLIVSDVVGDRVEDIASGPTSADTSSFIDAYRILKNYGLWNKVPMSIRKYISKGLKGEAEETLKELPNRVYNVIIASNEIACKTIYEEALRRGYRAYILTTTLEGEAKDTALAIGSIIQEIYRFNRPFNKPVILIAGGETTVTIHGEHGMGGPNQEFALSTSRKIAGLHGTAVLAIDTDGTDGPTDAAGGLVDSYSLNKLLNAGIDVEEALHRHDAYNALKKINSLVITGPTMTNVNSLYIIGILGLST
ncbi:MAG: glycerate kinase [Thermoprotei archaeon]|nr:MAG: glycerate kinase [Thermoprotei archaeon]